MTWKSLKSSSSAWTISLALIACGNPGPKPKMERAVGIDGTGTTLPSMPGANPATNPGSNPEITPGTTPGTNPSIPGPGVMLPPEFDLSIAGAIPGKRLWRLTNDQYASTVDALLNKTTNIESMFEAETPPAEGFGNEATVLSTSDTFASTLEYAIYNVVKDGLADLEKQLSCKKFTAINDECLGDFIGSFGARAFGRPVTAEEKTRYQGIYSKLVKEIGANEALAAVAETILRSPYTLYRSELGESGKKGNARLGNHELARSLAFALTNSPPDAELLEKANDGSLADDKVYNQQARRLLGSEGFAKGFSEYTLRWSGVRWMKNVSKNKELFPEFKDNVKSAMVQEVRNFALHAVKANKSNFVSFLTSGKTTITPPLAPIYGQMAFEGTKELDTTGTERSGVITLPGVVATHSADAENSPFHRAIFLLSKLMCVTLPPPPDDPAAVADPNPNQTERERYEAHSSNPGCSNCHLRMDPFGFSLEHYDAIGRYRTMENNKPINASGKMIETSSSNGEFKSAIDMLARLAQDQDTQTCFIKNAFRYVNGRVDVAEDEALIANALKAFKTSNLDMSAVFLVLVTTESFKTRKDGK